jgi:ABC-type lipoprotein release transport system permease subunit
MRIPLVYNLRNLWTRKLTTALTIVGIALVVFCFAAVLMLAYGLKKTLVATGSDQNVIFLRKGAQAEIMSIIEREQANILETQPEAALDEEGKPLVTKELVVLKNLIRRSNNNPVQVVVRGVSGKSLELREQVKLVEGRTWRAGMQELIAGRRAAELYEGAGLGEKVRFGVEEWTVVGVFDASKSGFDSEIWGDVELLMPVFERPVFTSVIMRMKDPTLFPALKARVEADPRLSMDVKRERDYYEDQSRIMATFIRIMGLAVVIIFSFGAMIGAMITMYAAVANRVRDIGTLRALGFRRRSVLLSFLVESLLMAVIGATIGILASTSLQFITISTINWGSFSELAFGFSLSWPIVLWAFVFAIVMGILGGCLPAVRAARVAIVNALRTT